MKKTFLAFISLSAVGLLSACGMASKATEIPMDTVAQRNQPRNIGPVIVADGPMDITYNYDAYYWSLVKGSYDGTVQGWVGEDQNSAMSQAYTFTLGTDSSVGTNAAVIRFSSSGDLPINFTKFVTPGLIAQRSGTVVHFSFVSEKFNMPDLSPMPIALVVNLAFSGVNRLDPTHSTVYLVECGFSSGLECNGDTLQNVWFLQDLRKR